MKVCHNCGCELGEAQEYMGVEFSQGDADIIVFDKYPPGDDGLGYACGFTCFQQYVNKREQERIK